MSKKIEFTKAELKTPDALLANLKQGFEWSASHSKAVMTFLFLFIFLGGGWAAYSVVQQQTEDKLQESFYLAEKQLNELQKKFTEAQKPKEDIKDKTGKAKKVPEVAVKPSQNPDVDYVEPINEMKKLISANPGSKAANVAALTLSEIYVSANKPDEALKVLDLVTKGNKVNGLLGAFSLKTKGNLQADMNQCSEAIKTWQKLNSSDESLSFVSSEIKIKMALCHEKLDQNQQAEMIYNELIDKVKNPAQQPGKKNSVTGADRLAGQEAEKYLRLMKIKKDQRGS